MADLQKFKDHFILFCEAGFIAVNHADEETATRLFKASRLLNPKNTLPQVGEGYMHMMKLELKDACIQFKEVMEKEPENEMARAFLGLCYALTTTEVLKGEKLLEETSQKAEDPMVKTLSNSALEFIEKFVKKEPSPLEQPTKKKKKKKE